jgi:prolyl-tRNA synthetase
MATQESKTSGKAPKAKTAISPTRDQDFPGWFQQVIKEADLAENSAIRGCMVVKPEGYALWEAIQRKFDPMLKSVGVRNAAFPLFIPLEFFQREAQHAEGFATEVAVVTHRRLAMDENGKLRPSTPLEEPFIVRPTSEMIIGDSMARWIQSYRDLPMKLNQWCSVVRMEMRPRLFLRTTEFWWHEGHSAHATADDAQTHTLQMFELYRKFIVDTLAIAVVPGEKIPTERFAGAERTFTLEAMMQDYKALQAATSHYLGQNFARAMDIKFQSAQSTVEFAYTTSWGMSTRIIGALIMVHADDDGLRIPPRIAARHAVIVPVVPKEEQRAEVMAFAEKVRQTLSEVSYDGSPISVEVDARDIRGAEKYWDAVKRGTPLRIEIGPKELPTESVAVSRRDVSGSKEVMPLTELRARIAAILEEQQQSYLAQAQSRLDANIRTDIQDLGALQELYGAADSGSQRLAWVRAKWSGDASSLALLDPLKLTVRCIPLDQTGTEGRCLLTGKPATQDVIFARAY